MYGKNATLTNETSGTINVLQSGTTAMFTQVGKLTNKGKINLAAADAIGLSHRVRQELPLSNRI